MGSTSHPSSSMRLAEAGAMRAAVRAARQELAAADERAAADGSGARETARLQALEHLQRARLIDRDDSEVNILLAIVLLELGRPAQARVKALRALSSDANDPRANLTAALALLKLGAIERGIQHLQRATEAQPGYAHAWFELGKALADRVQRDEDALKAFDKAVWAARVLGDIGLEASAKLRAAGVRFGLKRYDDVVRDGEELVARLDQASRAAVPDAVRNEMLTRLNFVTGWALFGLKRYDDAAEQFERARRAPQPIPFLAARALAATRWRQGRYREAWRILADVELPQIGHDCELVQPVGETLQLRGEYARARGTFEIGIQRCPRDPDMWRNLVGLYLELRDAEPADRPVWYWRGRQAFIRAEALLDERLRNQRTAENLLALGSLLVSIEEYEAARQLLDEAETLDSGLELVHANLGIVHRRMGEHSKAVSAFEHALRLDPDNLTFQVALAEAQFQLKQLDAAEDGYHHALTKAPGNLDALIGLGEVLIARGDNGDTDAYAEAIETLSRARTIAQVAETGRLRDRTASRRLFPRQRAAVCYAIGYAILKEYEAAAAGPLRTGDRRHLDRARDAFRAAHAADPTFTKAERASSQLEAARKHVGRGALAWWLAPLAILVLVQLTYYWQGFPPAGERLDNASYITLTFGLLVLLIAAVSLPELRKLGLGGITLEKARTEETELPIRVAVEPYGALAAGMHSALDYRPPPGDSVPQSRPPDEPREEARRGTDELGRDAPRAGAAAPRHAHQGSDSVRPTST